MLLICVITEAELRVFWLIFPEVFFRHSRISSIMHSCLILKRLNFILNVTFTLFMLVSKLAYSWTLKRGGAAYSYVTSVDFQWNTQRYILEDINLYNHRCEKSYKLNFYTSGGLRKFFFMCVCVSITESSTSKHTDILARPTERHSVVICFSQLWSGSLGCVNETYLRIFQSLQVNSGIVSQNVPWPHLPTFILFHH
jgi:hypothetical protein